MQLTVIKKNRLNTFVLPEKISGNFWITDFENGKKLNLINIEADNNNWKLISNNDAYLIDDKEVMIPFVYIKNNAFYLIKNNYKNEKYYIYVSDVYDKTFKEFGINDKDEINIGFDKCDITYKLPGMPKKTCKILKKENDYYIDVLDEKASVYINQIRVYKEKRLEYGDIIFIFGLKVILLRKNSKDYLLVNNPANLVDFNASFVNIMPIASNFKEDYMELSLDNYNDKDNFYRTPYFYNGTSTYKVKLDSPPGKREEKEQNMLLTVGPMLTMSMTSVVSLISTLNNVSSGKATMESSMASVITCGAMLASCLLWPIVTRVATKVANKAEENKRQRLYKKYIEKEEKNIEKERMLQTSRLKDNYFNVEDCQTIISSKNTKLWQKRITDADFLKIPIGFGDVPMDIDISYPERHFSLTDDNLLDIAYALGEKERILENVPVAYSFYENNVTGIVGSNTLCKSFIDRVILQMITLYSYDEVKFVTFTSSDNETSWDYIKILPYSWNNNHEFRYFGSNNDDYREIIYNLESIYNMRKNMGDKIKIDTHYIVITDAIKSIDNYDFIKNLMIDGKKYGFSVILLVDRLTALPNECKNFINVSDTDCTIFSSMINNSSQSFKLDNGNIDDLYKSSEILANIKFEVKTEEELALPKAYHFLEMYQVGKVEQLNSLERWHKSNPILSLSVPIGIGKSGEIIALDLHEKYHGPHGLVAGTTGSGKSEFIIDYILSLAVNFDPREVQIILIDYKGGSLAGAFTSGAYRLPHIVGTITNLDGNELNRSLASIESEVKRRQKEFNEAREISGESTIDIYKYQKLFREGRIPGKEQISHLFIISDEFAELKEQQPEFMDKLISVARVGRSLGIHLILATQKPGGVVDAQIWSNTRFRVCLKVQDTSDSNEVIKKPDAAYLKGAGRFLLQVGYDEVYTLGQAAWAGGAYFPNESFKKEQDTSVNRISNIGFVMTSKDNKVVNNVKAMGEELPNIVKYLANQAASENITVHKLWLDKIPEKIYIDELKEKYHYQKTDYNLNILIGEYDDPSSQNQYPLYIPFSKFGNTVIYGIADSGKDEFLSSMVYSSISSFSPNEVNFYILDFGSETLKSYEGFPHVGNVILSYEEDKINNLIKMLYLEIESRKKLFSTLGGSYNEAISKLNEKVPSIVVVINNFESFSELYEETSEELVNLTRDASKYGIYFCITATNENTLRLRLRQNFSVVYALNQAGEYDYPSSLGNIKGKLPAKFKGRGLFKKENVYEFQTALITKDDEHEYLKEYLKKFANISYHAKRVPVLPDVVNYEFVKNELNSPINMVVGVNKTTLEVEKYNFKKNSIDIISSYEIENTNIFLNSLINQAVYFNYYGVMFINASDYEFNNKYIDGKVITKDFDNIIMQIEKYVSDVYDIYEKNNFNENLIKGQKKYMIFVYGVSDFINKLSFETKQKLLGLINKNNSINLITFILVDSPDVIKGYAYDDWFKAGADTARGVWIGSGVTDETLFKINKYDKEDREEITNEYGYLINNGKISRIKLLSDFNKQD